MNEKKNFPNIAGMQNPGSQRTGYATGGKVSKAKGGRVTKATGGRVKKAHGGPPSEATMARRRGEYQAFGAAKQLKKKPPGRAATQGIGMKKGGRVSKAKGGRAKK